MNEQTTVAIPQLTVRWNNNGMRELCALCGQCITTDLGPELFKAGTWEAVCHDCGDKYDTNLMEALKDLQNIAVTEHAVQVASDPHGRARLLGPILQQVGWESETPWETVGPEEKLRAIGLLVELLGVPKQVPSGFDPHWAVISKIIKLMDGHREADCLATILDLVEGMPSDNPAVEIVRGLATRFTDFVNGWGGSRYVHDTTPSDTGPGREQGAGMKYLNEMNPSAELCEATAHDTAEVTGAGTTRTESRISNIARLDEKRVTPQPLQQPDLHQPDDWEVPF